MAAIVSVSCTGDKIAEPDDEKVDADTDADADSDSDVDVYDDCTSECADINPFSAFTGGLFLPGGDIGFRNYSYRCEDPTVDPTIEQLQYDSSLFVSGAIKNVEDAVNGTFELATIDQIVTSATSTWESPPGVELDFLPNEGAITLGLGHTTLIAIDGPAGDMVVGGLGYTVWRSDGPDELHSNIEIYGKTMNVTGG